MSDIVIETSAQVGKSEMLINMMGYTATQDPGPILFLQPTLEMATAFSKDRISPAIAESPLMTSTFDPEASRDSGNTLLHKEFAGGQLTMSGANSPASLASRPIKILLADEIDRFPISAGNREGDPLSLAEKRTNNFWNRKRVKVSTPTVKGASRIEVAYAESDRRRFFVPCPHCAEMQILIWGQVKWDDDPAAAWYVCVHCASVWTEAEKREAVTKGEWRGTAPFTGIAGFHISELYSPWSTLGSIAAAFVAAKSSQERLKVWVNTSLGETWEADAERADPTSLMARAEPYELGTIPQGVGLVVASVDTQGDRLELYLWGFGEGEEAWVLDRHVFYGDPSHSVVWEQLLEQLDRPLKGPNGAPIVARAVAVDSGGGHTHAVYNFCRSNSMRRTEFGLQEILAIKGSSQAAATILGKPTDQDVDFKGSRIRKGVKLWPIGASAAKTLLYGRFKIETPGAGFVHFSDDLPEEFYDQLTAEKQVTKYVKGFARLEWTKENGKRNEALDCAVYAYAMGIHLGMQRLRKKDWDKHRRRIGEIVTPQPTQSTTAEAVRAPAPMPAPPTPAQQPGPPSRRQPGSTRKGNWVTRW